MPDLPLGAVIAFDFEKWDVDEEIAIVHGAGVVRTQVYRNYVHGVTAQRIRQILDEANLVADSMHGYIELEMLGGPHFDLSAKAPKARRAALEIVRGEAEYAHVLGCRDIIVHPVGPGCTRDDAFRPDALAESAEHVARLGEEADVRFLLENMPPPMFGTDAEVLRAIVDEADSPALGLVYDSGHASLAGRTVETVRQMGPRLWGVHMHDNGGKEDDHFLPGMGVVALEDAARALAEVKFGGTFMLEIYRETSEVRRDLTPERLAYIQRLCRIASGLGA